MEGVTRTQDDDLHPSGSLRPAPALASVFPPQKPSKQSSNILSNPLYDRPQPQPQAMSAKSLFKSKLPTTAPTAPAPLQIKRADLRQIVSPELQMVSVVDGNRAGGACLYIDACREVLHNIVVVCTMGMEHQAGGKPRFPGKPSIW
eukprot:evm.model.scf_2578EXC.3 EVM.evm.TU.scf_2578EXC.3   scf_2578EXC:19198-19887(+)